MAIKEKTCRWDFLLLGLITWAQRGLTQRGCVCPRATVVIRLPAEIPGEACCLNYSGSALGRVSWPGVDDSQHRLEILDLSHCNITHIELSFTGASTRLREVRLHHNGLVMLPEDFLARQPRLQVLDLGWNLLRELPEGLLRGSEDLRQLDLRGNRLRSLAAPLSSVLRTPRLRRLELDDNPWDCSCALVELLVGIAAVMGDNGTIGGGGGSSSLPDLTGNLTCASPRRLAGTAVRSVRPADVCRPPGLTALFILLPLLILTGLVLCWCCGRKRKRKDATFGTEKRKTKKQQSQKESGSRLQSKRRPGTNGNPSLTCGAATTGSLEKGGGILKNQLLLRPASALLSSTRDIYEEVEVEAKMGCSSCGSRTSVASTEDGGSRRGRQGSTAVARDGEEDGDSEGGSRRAEAELDDVVSVSEVLKDSANREKAYLAQSTEYYSLVPGMDLGDWDHGEYESIDLA